MTRIRGLIGVSLAVFLLLLGVPFATSPMLAGISGLGHMILAGTFVLLFLILRRALRADAVAPVAAAPAASGLKAG